MVGKDVPAAQAKKVVDVTGLYVTPGLIDIHYHVGHGGAPLDWFTPEGRVHLQPLRHTRRLGLHFGRHHHRRRGHLRRGNFSPRKRRSHRPRASSRPGFPEYRRQRNGGGLEQSVDQMDVKKCAETLKKYPDIIVGVKTAHYWTEAPWDGEHTPWVAVDRAMPAPRLPSSL